jgi:cytoskeletal protein CcmA (bactofilin family)
MEAIMRRLSAFLIICILAGSFASAEETERTVLGGDTFVAGGDASLDTPADRDAFLSGFSVEADAAIAEDAHLSGFNVDISAPVGGDLYAAGFSVEVDAGVGGDLTAAGFKIKIDENADIAGNARLAARTITLESTLAGSLIAAAETLNLNGAVSGDVEFSGAGLKFGDGATIGGSLTYRTPEKIDIPASVIAAERVQYKKLEVPEALTDVTRTLERAMDRRVPSAWGFFFGSVMALAFLAIVAALCLAFAPDSVERLRAAAMRRPWTAILCGFLSLAMLIGLVPVSAMTLVGIPLIPIVLLTIVVVWILGYLLGVYALANRVIAAFRDIPDTLVARLVVVVIGLIAVAVLNFIPILGWLANLVILFLGLGALSAALFGRLQGGSGAEAAEV